MQNTEKLRLPTRVLFRRIALVTVLLVAGTATSVFSGCFHYIWGHPRSSILGGYQHAIVEFGAAVVGLPGLPASRMLNHFVWGVTSLGPLLAVWLIARCNLWQTVSGRLRAMTYIGCFLLGGMIANTAQRSIHQLQPNGWPPGGFGFSAPLRWPIQIDRLPGTRLNDYSLPLVDCLTIGSIIWVMFPLWLALRFRLTESEDLPDQKATFSIRTILVWTTALAGLLGWTQLLTWWAAPSSYLSNHSIVSAISDLIVIRIPSAAVTVLCVLTIAHASSRRWFQHFLLVFLAILMDGMGHLFIYSSMAALLPDPVPRYDAFTSPLLLYWSYISGRGFVAWAAFGAASRFGVKFVCPSLSYTSITSRKP